MEFVDTHCHIQSIDNEFTERSTRELWKKGHTNANDLILNAKNDGVKTLITVGCDLKDSKAALEFASQHENVYASIGIHPHEAKEYISKNQKTEFASLIGSNKLVAIGECGLDYFYNHSDKKDQLKTISDQIELALEHDLPLIFHVRDAFEDFWPLFNSLNSSNKPIRGVLHSYTDSTANLDKAISNNLFIGVNGIATFAKEHQLEMYKAIPLNNMLLETDSPFLTPVPFRGRINEPKNVRIIAEFLAKLRGEQLDEISRLTSTNAKSLFNLNKR